MTDTSNPSAGDVRARLAERFRPYVEKIRELVARRYRGRKPPEKLIRTMEAQHDPETEDAHDFLSQIVDRIVRIAEDNAAGNRVRYQFVALGEPRSKSLNRPELVAVDEWIESEETTPMTRESELIRALSVQTDWAKGVADEHLKLMKVANDSVDRVVKISEKLGDQLVDSDRAKYEYEWKWQEKKLEVEREVKTTESKTEAKREMWSAFAKWSTAVGPILEVFKTGRTIDDIAPTDEELDAIFKSDDPEIVDFGKLFRVWAQERDQQTRAEHKRKLDELAEKLTGDQRNAIKMNIAATLKPQRLKEIVAWLTLNGVTL